MHVHNFISFLTPDQWALLLAIGLGSPFAQYFLTEYNAWLNDPKRKALKEAVNWALSFAFPALGTIATFLVTNAQVSEAFPIFTTLYTQGQTIYLASLRFVKKAKTYKALYEASVDPTQL